MAAAARQRRVRQMVAVSNAVVVMAAMLAPAALPVAVVAVAVSNVTMMLRCVNGGLWRLQT